MDSRGCYLNDNEEKVGKTRRYMKCHSNWAIDILKRSGSIVKIFFRFTYRYGLRSCFIWYLVSGKAFILKEILGCNELGHFQIIVMMVGAVQ